MSLENHIATLAEKIEKLTQVTEALMNMRAEAIETVKNAASTGKAVGGSKAKDKDEPAKEEAKSEETKSEEPSTDEAKEDTLSDAIQEYTGLAGDDAAKRKEFIGNVKAIFAKVKATKRSEVPAEKEAAVEKAVRKLIEAAKAAEEEGDDDDDLL